MAECSESDRELFITQSKYSSRDVGSDTDNLLSGILDLEECIQRDVSEDLFSDISLGDDVKFCMVIEGIVLERRKLKKTRMTKGERIRKLKLKREIYKNQCEKMLSVITKTIKFWCVMSWMTNKLN